MAVFGTALHWLPHVFLEGQVTGYLGDAQYYAKKIGDEYIAGFFRGPASIVALEETVAYMSPS
jgi:hypothetical protein